jgi:uncharacterized protein (TIGR02145 family)
MPTFVAKLKTKINMKTFVTVIIVIILMLLGFWLYLGHECAEKDEANRLAMNEAVDRAVNHAIDSVNLHHALNQPEQRTHIFPKKEKKATAPAKKKPGNVFVDERDGQQYKTIEVDGRTWMAENLNYKTDNSLCYDDNADNCKKFGQLYTWQDASTSCPAGWHLPDDAEWSHLINFYGGIWEAGKELKEGGNSGFNVLMAGYHDKEGFYGKIGESSYHWSATEQNDTYASFKGIYESVDNVGTFTYTKADAFSVRCIKD